MSTCERPGPRRERPEEERIREVVDSVVDDDSMKEAYVAFAHELVRAERASYNVHLCSLRFPDYGRRTKMVVMKWFQRGLSGKVMWLIGEQLIPKPEVFHG